MPNERAKAVYDILHDCYDACDGFSEACFGNTYPSFCPINDKITARCCHILRGDNLNAQV